MQASTQSSDLDLPQTFLTTDPHADHDARVPMHRFDVVAASFAMSCGLRSAGAPKSTDPAYWIKPCVEPNFSVGFLLSDKRGCQYSRDAAVSKSNAYSFHLDGSQALDQESMQCPDVIRHAFETRLTHAWQ